MEGLGGGDSRLGMPDVEAIHDHLETGKESRGRGAAQTPTTSKLLWAAFIPARLCRNGNGTGPDGHGLGMIARTGLE